MAISSFKDSSNTSYIDRSNNAWKDYENIVTVISDLNQFWHIMTPAQSDLNQLWALKLGSHLSQLWHLTTYRQSDLNQLWGIKAASTLTQYYEDVSTPISSLTQYYNDAGLLSSSLTQLWNDALVNVSKLEQPYHLVDDIRTSLTILWGICQDEVRNQLIQLFNLQERDTIRRELTEYWSILSDDQINQTPNISVSVRGIPVQFTKLNIAGSRGDFRITSVISLPNEAEYAKFNVLDDVEIIIESDTFNLIVQKKHRPQISNDGTSYAVSLSSKCLLLTSPYSTTTTTNYAAGMSAVIAANIASEKSITVDWEVVNWFISEDKLYATSETPLEIIRKISSTPRAMIQSKKDGNMAVRKRYAVPISQWSTASPTRTFTESHFFKITENPVEKPGYNRVSVSDQLTASERAYLEYEVIDSYSKYVKGFIVPWDEAENPTLLTSGGGWINIIVEGEQTEQLTERIEFENGSASTSHPIYSVDDIEWLQESLGSITPSEDGRLSASYVDGDTQGCSLVNLTYTTKYMLWRVTSDRIESVQFILDLED